MTFVRTIHDWRHFLGGRGSLNLGLMNKLLVTSLLLFAACAPAAPQPPTRGHEPAPTTAPAVRRVAAPEGKALTPEEIRAMAALFNQPLLTGGQVAPRSYKAVNDDVSIFLQLNPSNPQEATSVRTAGVSLKGVFCSEAWPDKAFTHLHSQRPEARYADGHGGPPGEKGYWLMWINLAMKHGYDYECCPTPPPSCGAAVPKPDFQAPGAHKMTREEIAQLTEVFNQNPLSGGQVPPWLFRWVNEQAGIFLEFDDQMASLRYIGAAVKGEFCKSKQPSADFAHFQRANAASYQAGQGGPPNAQGLWLIAAATDSFEAGGRKVTPGPDRSYAATPAPDC